MAQRWSIISVFLLYITGSFSAPVVPVEDFARDSAVLSSAIPEREILEFNVLGTDDKGKSVQDITGFAGDSAVLCSSIPEHEIQNKTEEFNVPVRDVKAFFHRKVSEYHERKKKEKMKAGWVRGVVV